MSDDCIGADCVAGNYLGGDCIDGASNIQQTQRSANMDQNMDYVIPAVIWAHHPKWSGWHSYIPNTYRLAIGYAAVFLVITKLFIYQELSKYVEKLTELRCRPVRNRQKGCINLLEIEWRHRGLPV